MQKKKLAGVLSLFSGALALLAEKKPVKLVLGISSITFGGYYVFKTFREESAKVNTEAEETSKKIERSGLDIKKIESGTSLNKEEEVSFGEILLREAYNSRVFDNDTLAFSNKSVLTTLHVLQNVEKNRLIISIPLPHLTRHGLTPLDVRQHFSQVFEDFIRAEKLDMKLFLNQIGVHVGRGTDNYTYYDEIVKGENESFKDYLERVTHLIKLFDEDPSELNEEYEFDDDVEETIRIDQYLNLEFPIYPETSLKKGLDLISAMSLLNELMEIQSIYCKNSGKDVDYEFTNILFHPSDDYGTILQVSGKEIEEIDL